MTAVLEVIKILLTAGLAGGFSWWITVKSFEKQKQSTYLEEQISKFYGPVYFKLKALEKQKEVTIRQSAHFIDVVPKRLEQGITRAEAEEEAQKLIEVFESLKAKYHSPLIDGIVETIYSNGHLVDEENIRKELLDFLEYAVNFDFVQEAYRKKVPYDPLRASFEEVVGKIGTALEAKRKDYDELISQEQRFLPLRRWLLTIKG